MAEAKRQKRFWNFSSHLPTTFAELYRNPMLSDATIIIEDVHVPVHRVFLAAESEFFRNNLYTKVGSCSENFVLTNTPLEGFLLVLQYMYGKDMELETETMDNILMLLRLGERFGLTKLVEGVCRCLTEFIDVYTVCQQLQVARHSICAPMEKLCWEFIDEHVEDFIDAKSYLGFTHEEFCEMLKRKTMKVAEVKFFQAAEDWIKFQNVETIQSDEILSCIDYGRMSVVELVGIVGRSELVTKDQFLQLLNANLFIDVNVATPENGLTTAVISGHYFYDEYGHEITLGKEFCVNNIQFSLKSATKYLLQYLNEQNDWITFLDYSNYNCVGRQDLYFQELKIKSIRIVSDISFELHDLQIFRKSKVPKLISGFICPTENICRPEYVDGSDFSNILTETYAPKGLNTKYVDVPSCGSFCMQFNQPYLINEVRLIMWTFDGRQQSYNLKVFGGPMTEKLVELEYQIDVENIVTIDNVNLPTTQIDINACVSTVEDFRLARIEARYVPKKLVAVNSFSM